MSTVRQTMLILLRIQLKMIVNIVDTFRINFERNNQIKLCVYQN